MSKSRIVYCIAVIAICIAACFFNKTLSSPEWINSFSFWSGVVTLIALVIAIGEVFNSGTTQALIKKAIDKHATEQAKISSASSISEVIALLDESNTKVCAQDYLSSMRLLQLARRFLARIDSRFFSAETTAGSLSDLFNKAESKIQTASHSTLAAPITPRQRSNISVIVCEIKSKIEVIERTGAIN